MTSFKPTVVQVFVTTTPVTEAARFVPQIVMALCNMPEDCKRHFRSVHTRVLCFGFLGSGSLIIFPDPDPSVKKQKN
jgi:hypothetical protein